jgi:1,4-alpha-glucan branching enzyme
MPRGYLALVLHAHLPFVRHPEHERPLEERWLHEAIAECYLPLIAAFDRLEKDGVPFSLTMSLTPPLAAMLNDELLRSRFDDHLARMRSLCEHEIVRLEGDGFFGPVAHFYQTRLAEIAATWERIGRDVVGALVRHADAGRIDLITCSATHAYLPGLLPRRASLKAQLRLGVAAFKHLVGRDPTGAWLPECAYEPAFDADIAEAGIRYTVLDTHGVTRAEPRPAFGVFHPIVSPSGVAFFARDDNASRQVWSREIGYPGNPFYRDFYRDIGFDLPETELYGEVGPFGSRVMTGLKYHRITGGNDAKLAYQPGIARQRASIDAADFVAARLAEVDRLSATMPVPPVIVAPYDAELFGHWWFEGPWFLEDVFRHLDAARKAGAELVPASLRGYLASHPTALAATPAASSWGAGGHGEVWLGPAAAPLWRHVHHGSQLVEHLVSTRRHETGIRGEALDLAIREALLLQTSDWPFIVKTGSMVEYAEARTRVHANRIRRLADIVEGDSIRAEDVAWMRDLDGRDNFLRGLPGETLRAAYDP